MLRPYYPGLDGLRAFAFFIVFLFHYGPLAMPSTYLGWGRYGVDIFFVLSGFLITGILYDSLHRPDFFSRFYLRRSLRIFPLFFGFWLVVLLLTPIFHVAWNRYMVTMAAYLGNLFLAGANLHQHLSPGLVPFTTHFHHTERRWNLLTEHLWSLCVEEQFYLVWPAVVWFVRSRTHLLRLCIAIIVLEPALRVLYMRLQPDMVTAGAIGFNSIFRVDTLLFGAFLALWLRGPALPTAQIRRLALAITLAALVVLASLSMDHQSPFTALADLAFTPTLVALASSGILLLTIIPASLLSRILQWGPLAALGQISYGLYFFHELPMTLVSAKARELAPRHLSFTVPLGVLFCTVITAWLSYRFFETPFLKLKERFSPPTGTAKDRSPDLETAA